jgi:hypothetical protein
MEMLLKVLVAWLSINSGLPATDDYPHVEFALAEEMAALRLSHTQSAGGLAAVSQLIEVSDDVQAVYDDRSRTIYLLEGWSGTTPAEVSVLVHELAHHLQNTAALKYDCVEAREKPAYQAQQKWLELFGTDLATEFGMDSMTVLLRTNCIH